MEIRFSCFKCGRKLKADPEAAGLGCDCPDCGTSLTIPEGPWKPEASFESVNPPAWEEPSTAAQPDVAQGKFTCPVCWLRFDAGNIMHIAVHDSLRGDPLLGEDAQQRFLATRFNNAGQALDAMSLPSSETAEPRQSLGIDPTESTAGLINFFKNMSDVSVYVAFCVYEDSFSAFIRTKQLASDCGLAYGWEPFEISDGPVSFSAVGHTPKPQ